MGGSIRAELCQQVLENTYRSNDVVATILHSDRDNQFPSQYSAQPSGVANSS